MPYIKQELRKDIDERLNPLIQLLDWCENDEIDGVMNYVITKIIRSQYNNGHYGEYNAAVGVLECAKLELYRRAIAPYEDIKIQENGDV